MQLVAYGAQDIYLTGNPQITFFKVVYRRHTNFSMESIEQTFNGQADFGKKVTCTISRNGDLINRVYLQVTLPQVNVPTGTAFRWLDWVGHILIRNVDVEIGGQRIDKHYGDWLHIWNELTQPAGKQLGYSNMVGNTPTLTAMTGSPTAATTVPSQTLYIPLEFWFARNAGLALPLIALQYHEVRINLEMAPTTDCYWAGTYPSTTTSGVTTYTAPTGGTTITTNMNAVTVPSLVSASLWVDYVYLDTDERRRYAQQTHEYLIEQLQYTGAESTSQTNNKFKLNFNHPCKELIFVAQPDAVVSTGTYAANNTIPPLGPQWFNYTDQVDNTLGFMVVGGAAIANGASVSAGSAGGFNSRFTAVNFKPGGNPVQDCKLQLNGHDRFATRYGSYFNLVQPYQHHENVPSTGINVYSFGLRPEDHQPSGTCNFSRIDNATLQLTLTPNAVSTANGASGSVKVRVYAVNYNVLRIMSGMGGLAYSD